MCNIYKNIHIYGIDTENPSEFVQTVFATVLAYLAGVWVETGTTKELNHPMMRDSNLEVHIQP